MAESVPGWQPDLTELEQIRRDAGETVKATPVFTSESLGQRCGGRIVLKAESLQRTGSFKLRGVLAKLAAGTGESRGVVAASAGNHGQALAFAARSRGIACTVVMPRAAAVSKVDAVSAFGADVRLVGDSIEECLEVAREIALEDDLLFVHPFDDLEIIKGQAGVGLEMAEQIEELTTVVCPIGGGGLISGVAGALKTARPGVRIVGVQASGCAAFPASLRSGRPEAVASSPTLADGIAVKRPGGLTLALVDRWVDEVATVDEDAIAEAMVFLAERGKLIVEGAGAVGVAAVMSGAVAPAPSGVTAIVLSGGNVDAHVLAKVINRHQTGVGRRARIFTRISDRPGGLADLLQVVADAGGNILDLTHVRDGVALEVEETGLELAVESRSRAHQEDLVAAMTRAGYAVEVIGGGRG